MLYSVIAICIGASCGSLLRWGVTNALNAWFPNLPPGTLAVNLIGGYLIGLALTWIASHPHVGVEWRLLVITGFLGSLTTFSTFSAEVITLFHQDKVAWAFATIGAHMVGALVMTYLGVITLQFIQRAGS